MDTKQELQEKLILYQILQSHLEELRQQMILLEKRFIEIETTKQAISDLDGLEQKNDILIPLGSGCYTYGRVTNREKLLVDLGAGVFVNKERDSSKSLLDEKRGELEKLANNIQNEMVNVSNKMDELLKEIESKRMEE